MAYPLMDHNGSTATQLFCVIPAIVPMFFLFLFYITIQFLIVNLSGWKSYVNFLFIELIFVLEKDTYLLCSYLEIIQILFILAISEKIEIGGVEGHHDGRCISMLPTVRSYLYLSHAHENLVGDPEGQWWLAGKLLFTSFLKLIRLKRLKKYIIIQLLPGLQLPLGCGYIAFLPWQACPPTPVGYVMCAAG